MIIDMNPATRDQVFVLMLIVTALWLYGFLLVNQQLASIEKKIDRLLNPEEKQ